MTGEINHPPALDTSGGAAAETWRTAEPTDFTRQQPKSITETKPASGEPVAASKPCDPAKPVAANEPVAEARSKQRVASAYEGAVNYHQPPASREPVDPDKDSSTIVWSASPKDSAETEVERTGAMGPETLRAMEKVAENNASGLPFSQVEQS